MKLDGSLPVPRMTAEINERGDVAILRDTTPERDRELAYAGRARFRLRRCGACGDLGHQRNSFECPMADGYVPPTREP